jgi:hypothetical protein
VKALGTPSLKLSFPSLSFYHMWNWLWKIYYYLKMKQCPRHLRLWFERCHNFNIWEFESFESELFEILKIYLLKVGVLPGTPSLKLSFPSLSFYHMWNWLGETTGMGNWNGTSVTDINVFEFEIFEYLKTYLLKVGVLPGTPSLKLSWICARFSMLRARGPVTC